MCIHIYGKEMAMSISADASREDAAVLPQRDWYFIAEQSAPAPHFAHPAGCAALRIDPPVTRDCTTPGHK